jgi:hypothetical protein
MCLPINNSFKQHHSIGNDRIAIVSVSKKVLCSTKCILLSPMSSNFNRVQFVDFVTLNKKAPLDCLHSFSDL